MRFSVYILRSHSSGKIYIGQTADLENRIRQHNDSSHRLTLYTKRNPGPWELVYKEEYVTRAEAMKREKQLKSGQGREWLHKYIIPHSKRP